MPNRNKWLTIASSEATKAAEP